jgi:alkylhydroperoxidase family enzyme
VARDWKTADLSAEDRALCEHAARLTHDQKSNTPAHLDALRDHGFDDRAIHDATQVIGYFNYVTRVADGLGIDLEDFVKPWGEHPDGSDVP